MIAFEIGKTYCGRMIGDAGAVIELTVASRTKATIKTTKGETLRIAKAESEWNQAETVFPYGRYSMAPVIKADKVKADVPADRLPGFVATPQPNAWPPVVETVSI